eukprot:156136_1
MTKPLPTSLIVFICCLPAISIYWTVTSCYQYSFANNSFPKWTVWPWISFLGVYECDTFKYGLTVTGIALFGINYIWKHTFRNTCDHKTIYLIHWMLCNNLIVSGVAIIMTGWINTNHIVTQTFLSTNIQTMKWYQGWKTALHLTTAITFFMSSWLHDAIIVYYWRKNSNISLLSWYIKLFMVILVALSFGALLTALTFSVFVVNIESNLFLFHAAMNIVGFGQYSATFGYAVFWMSLILDCNTITKYKSHKH